jgi:hypothetical protein
MKQTINKLKILFPQHFQYMANKIEVVEHCKSTVVKFESNRPIDLKFNTSRNMVYPFYKAISRVYE